MSVSSIGGHAEPSVRRVLSARPLPQQLAVPNSSPILQRAFVPRTVPSTVPRMVRGTSSQAQPQRAVVCNFSMMQETIRNQALRIESQDREIESLRSRNRDQARTIARLENKIQAETIQRQAIVPFGQRRSVQKKKLFHREDHSQRYNDTFVLYLMRLLSEGLTYSSIISATRNLNALLEPFDSVIDLRQNTLSKATLHRYLLVLGTMNRIYLATRLTQCQRIQSGTDETPDSTGVPAMVLMVRDMEEGQNLILGLRQMARKRATDFLRLQRQIITALFKTSETEGSYVTDFLAKLRLRVADGCPTESRLTRLIQNEINEETDTRIDLHRLTCSLHAINTSLRQD